MYPYVFKIQIRALLRASVYGNLKILLPLITTAEQIKETLAIIEDVKSELKSEKIPFKEDVPVGVMIETAAAAICSDCISKESDFFSIGTNDLTQYTLGVDRENSKVSELYDEFDLSVLRLIDFTVTNAKKAKNSVERLWRNGEPRRQYFSFRRNGSQKFKYVAKIDFAGKRTSFEVFNSRDGVDFF